MATEKWLISAWDLIEWLDNIDLENMHRILRCKKAKLIDTKGVRHMINTVPKVDAVEVVHAEWRDIYKRYANHRHECTACKGKALYSLERDVLNRWIEVEQLSAYCPHCGAKMDGDGNG